MSAQPRRPKLVETKEQWIPLRDVPRHLPGRRRHASTVFRWASRGLKNGSVKLQTLRIGGELATTPDWLEAFFNELSDCPRCGSDDVHYQTADSALEHALKKK